MLEGKHVAVVIPAYNEEKLLETTVAGVPAFVDRIYIVDDASRDANCWTRPHGRGGRSSHHGDRP